MEDNIETVHEIVCVLDALIMMAKIDRAPVRAVSVLERARAEAKACLDKFDRSSDQTSEGSL